MSTQTLERPVPPRTPLILAGAKQLTAPAVPAADWDEQRQISVVPGTDIPACTRPEYLPGSTSTAYTDNIKDEDD